MAAANKFTTCQFILEKCAFGSPALASTCVQNFCLGEPYGFGSCATVLTGTPANCCSQSDPASCIAAFQVTQGYANAGDACLQIEYEVVACANANPGFGKLTLAQQAGCLCYDTSGNFSPDTWDNNAASCVATGAQAHPTVYSDLAANNGAAVTLCAGVAGGSGSAASSTAVAAVVSSTSGADSNTAASTPTATSESTTSNAAKTTQSSASSTSSSATPSTSAKSGAGGDRISYLEMKWVAAGLWLFLPGLIFGAL